jgi:DNA-binding response OmpR family regulator
MGIVVCTGGSTVAQRVRALRLGADDWLAKPCHPEELIARVEAVARRRRRTEGRQEGGPVVSGELEIRQDRFQAFVGGGSVDLTRREFELLELLSGAEGRVLEREDIYRRVWGYEMARGDRSVDVCASCARSSRRPRRDGATSTRTSAWATASRPSPRTAPPSRSSPPSRLRRSPSPSSSTRSRIDAAWPPRATS